MSIIIFALILATLVEGTVEYFFGKYQKAKPFLMYIALLFGLLAAFAYQVDLIAYLVALLGIEGVTLPPAWVGYAVSGILLGRGSNYLNDLISRIRSLGGQPNA